MKQKQHNRNPLQTIGIPYIKNIPATTSRLSCALLTFFHTGKKHKIFSFHKIYSTATPENTTVFHEIVAICIICNTFLL